MITVQQKLSEAMASIKSKVSSLPEIGLVLGTGLGGLAQKIQIEHSIDYKDIPHMPLSTVLGHEGKLLLGSLGGKSVAALSGRFHYYEGYSLEEVTFGVRLLSTLGCQRLLLSNVSGGLKADMIPGEIVLINDHINFMGGNPLVGKNEEELGPRFPDMLNAYDPDFNALALKICVNKNIKSREGCYVALSGPSLETPAEYNFLNIIGADVVGMSTVPEVIAARHMGVKVNVVSIVSNVCFPIENITKTTVEEVIKVAGEATKELTALVLEIFNQLDTIEKSAASPS